MTEINIHGYNSKVLISKVPKDVKNLIWITWCPLTVLVEYKWILSLWKAAWYSLLNWNECILHDPEISYILCLVHLPKKYMYIFEEPYSV